jgi:MSHA pilin protein MshC
VITLAGVLSFVAATRMNDRGDADARGFAEQVASTLRFAQKAAVAQRRNVYVSVTTASRRIRVCLDASCTQVVAAPIGGELDITGPDTVTLTAGSTAFSFDALGRPSFASAVTLTAANGARTFSVVVEAQTGYVH